MEAQKGLKQAPRKWYEKLSTTLSELEFVRTDVDHCLYSSNDLTVLIYVDDIIIAGKDLHSIEEFKEKMKDKFKLTDNGKVYYFLGFEIDQRKSEIAIRQAKYCIGVLQKYNMLECRPSYTPINSTRKDSVDESALPEDNFYKTNYRQIVGSLMYLMLGTRPDLAFSVGYASRFLECPTAEDAKNVKRILRCLVYKTLSIDLPKVRKSIPGGICGRRLGWKNSRH